MNEHPTLSQTVLAEDVKTAALRLGEILHDPGYLVLTTREHHSAARAMKAWRDFASLPDAMKSHYRRPTCSGRAAGGWLLLRESPVYMSHMDEHERDTAKPKQQFGCSADESVTRWPDEKDCPGFSKALRACLRELDAVSKDLLSILALVLGQAADFLEYAPGYMALSAYPGESGAGKPGACGLDAHSDATVFTLLTQRERALQIQDRHSRWQDAPILTAGELRLLPGDWMELWTNGTIGAVRHRVLDTPYPRPSLSHFQSVAPMSVGPLETCVSKDRPARYPTVPSSIPYVGGASGVPRWQAHAQSEAGRFPHPSNA